MMRILVLVLNFSPLGGLEIFGRDLSHALERLGHDVEIWSVLEDIKDARTESLPVRYLAPQGRQAKSIYYRTLPFVLAAKLAREAERFDLIIGAHPLQAAGLYLASRIRPNVRYWVCTYGSDVWGKWSYLKRLGLKHARRIIAINTYTKEMIQSRLPSSLVEIMYPSVSKDFLESDFIEKERGSSPILLTVSRISRVDSYKGHDMVIQALPLIQQRLGKKVLYRIVGEGDGVEGLRKLAEEHGVSSSVEFAGRLDKRSLLAAYRSCDILIMPSRMEKLANGIVTGEGFGIVYIEAAAAGKPVIGSTQGGAPEAFRDGLTGIAINPFSVPEIVEAVCTLLSEPDLRQRMGQAGKQLVRDNFSTEAFDKKLAALLEKAV